MSPVYREEARREFLKGAWLFGNSGRSSGRSSELKFILLG